MARIRTVKPAFFTSEELSAVSAEAHLLAAGLLCYADDEGYFNANPKLVQAAIFPLRELSSPISDHLQELQRAGYIDLGSCDGRRYGRIVNFSAHQKICHPNASKISKLPIQWKISGSVLEDSRKLLEDSRELLEPSSKPPEPFCPEGNKEGNKEGKKELEPYGSVETCVSTPPPEPLDMAPRMTDSENPPAGEPPKPRALRPEDFANAWNRHRGSLPKLRDFPDSRRKKVQTRIRQGVAIERFVEAVKLCTSMPFLLGNNPTGWVATFDWLVDNDRNIAKVLEGNYERKEAAFPPIRASPKPNLAALERVRALELEGQSSAGGDA